MDNKHKYFYETTEEMLQHSTRCASCIHSKGVEKDRVYCYNSAKSNYPYGIDDAAPCEEYQKREQSNEGVKNET